MAVMVKSKWSSEACLLLDLSFPCRFTTFTTSEIIQFVRGRGNDGGATHRLQILTIHTDYYIFCW